MSQTGTAATAIPHSTMRRVEWETFARIAQNAAVTLPVEQTIVWDSFDAAMSGREPWGRVVYERPDGSPRALLSLTRMSVRGFPYLWARHAPVWLNGAPTRSEEADLYELLLDGVRFHDPSVVFVRAHFHHGSDRSHELLQTMTYDRTVVLDLGRSDDDEAVLASFKSRGRRDVRKALRNEDLTYHDETSRAEEVFSELYEILAETGERDGFRAAPEATYRTMLRTLGPQHARLYVVRRRGGRALVWSLVTVWGDCAMRRRRPGVQGGLLAQGRGRAALRSHGGRFRAGSRTRGREGVQEQVRHTRADRCSGGVGPARPPAHLRRPGAGSRPQAQREPSRRGFA